MTPDDSFKNILFGLMAVQVDAISKTQLVAGLETWVGDRSRELSDILIEGGVLQADECAALTALVTVRLTREACPDHHADSLAAVSAVADALAGGGEANVQATINMASERLGSIFDLPPATDRTTVDGGHSDAGRFRIVKFHDEGGLGRVYEAFDKELNRSVALKEIKENYADIGESRQRFILEAEITGRLQHPGIVPVYGLGQYKDGRPFYAMRFVEGMTLREAIADYHNTDWKQRPSSDRAVARRRLLSQFLDACNAIFYAHRRGVLHRDIKPGNIMLGKYGETLVVDWGLAKMMGHREEPEDSGLPPEQTLRAASGSDVSETVMGRVIGSPAFMSPEQARGEHHQLDATTDVYGLGATLYTILTNEAPFRGSSSEEVLSRVRQGRVPSPAKVNPRVAKPLSAICLKAMAAERCERYPSVKDLADDVEKYLADQPVSALPENALQSGFRWMRRNKSRVISGTAVVAACLVAALFFQTWRHSAARSKAQQVYYEADYYRQVSDIKNPPLAEASAKAADFDRRLASFPELRELNAARYMDYFQSRQAYDLALNYAKTSLRLIQERPPGTRDLLIQDRKRDIARIYFENSDYREAVAEYEAILAEDARTNSPNTFTKNNLAAAYQAIGDRDSNEKSLQLLNEVIEFREQVYGVDHEYTFTAMNNKAMVLHNLGRTEEAIALSQRVRDFGSNSVKAVAEANLAFFQGELGDYVASRRQYLAELSRQRTLGKAEDDLEVLTTKVGIAYLSKCLGEYGEAEELYQQVVAGRQRQLGADHDHTLFAQRELADTYLRTNRCHEACNLFEQCYQVGLDKNGYDANTDRSLDAWVNALVVCEELELAKQQGQKLLDARQANNFPTEAVAMANSTLAEILIRQGAYDQAAEYSDEAQQIVVHDDDDRRAQSPVWCWSVACAQMARAAAAFHAEDYESSEDLLLAAAKNFEQQNLSDIPDRLENRYRWCVERLVRLYEATEQPAQAEAWRVKLRKIGD